MLKNRYILREKVSSGFCKDGTEFIFDTEDFEKNKWLLLENGK